MVKSQSGISLTENAAQLIQEISKSKSEVTVAFLRITNQDTIDFDPELQICGDFCLNDVVDKLKLAPALPHWIVFMSSMKAIDCSDNKIKRTIKTPIVISWCSDQCTISQKMKFAASKGPVEHTFGDCVRVEVHNLEDMTPDEIIGARRMKMKLNGWIPTEFCHQTVV